MNIIKCFKIGALGCGYQVIVVIGPQNIYIWTPKPITLPPLVMRVWGNHVDQGDKIGKKNKIGTNEAN